MARLTRDFEPAELGEIFRSCNVARSVLVQAEETDADTDHALDMARRTDFIAGVVGWIDMDRHDAAENLARRAENPLLLGFRLWLLTRRDEDWILNPRFAPVLREIADRGLSLDVLLRPPHIAPFCRLLDRHPDLRVVICHAAKPEFPHWRRGDRDFAAWSDGLRALRGRNCFIKLSGLATEAGDGWSARELRPYVDAVLDIFGPSRTMWGSDWPVINRAGGYEKWLGACRQLTSGFSEDDRRMIFGGAATEFYRLC